MGKGSASSGALAPLRPVSELLDHLQEVTGSPGHDVDGTVGDRVVGARTDRSARVAGHGVNATNQFGSRLS